MSSDNTSSVGGPVAVAGDIASDPIPAIRSLAADGEASVRRLRSAHIPQHVGMAAACRALAVEIPRALNAQVDADLKSGALGQRWDAIRASVSGEPDPTLTAIALLLREQGRAVMRHLIRRDKEWVADAHRLEGQADALEAQVQQLRGLLAIPTAAKGEEITLDAAPASAGELDARTPTEAGEGTR
jgi:hypothetical protein